MAASRRSPVSILAQPGGRALPSVGGDCRSLPCVSILAQPGGRALQSRCPCSLSAPSFNPRPARGPGAAMRSPRKFSAFWICVSILAQPGGRALRSDRRLWWIGDAGFNPRPARGPGAAALGDCPHVDAIGGFNPRPARGPGAANWQVLPGVILRSFNPRPARGPGAAIVNLKTLVV